MRSSSTRASAHPMLRGVPSAVRQLCTNFASHRSRRSRCLRCASRRCRRIGLRNRLVFVLYIAAWPPSVSQGIRPTRIDLCVTGLGISTVCLGAYPLGTSSATRLSFPHRDRTSFRLEEPMPCVFTSSSQVPSCFSWQFHYFRVPVP
jgi:hypothetical protein